MGTMGRTGRTSIIRRLLNHTRTGSNASTAENSSNTPSSLRSTSDKALMEFLDSTKDEKFHRKRFEQLESREYTREKDTDRYSRVIGYRHRDQNRYSDVIPFDATRVIVRPKLLGTTGEMYINASYIETADGKRSIATQGPRMNMVEQFWRMVWENVRATEGGTATIIMLTQCYEGRVEKCSKYWPEADQQFEFHDYEGKEVENTLVVQVVDLEEVENADCTVHTIDLSMIGQNQHFQVKHLLYNGWKDHSVPLSTDTFLAYFQLYRQYHTSSAPPIVHCSAGVGRTGVFIALDFLFSTVPRMTRKQILEDPVYWTIDEMRKWRMAMVYKASQLGFIYGLFRDMVLGRDDLDTV